MYSSCPTCFITARSGSFIPSLFTTLPFFIVRMPHFFIQNSMLMSVLNTCTIITSVFVCSSLLAYSFKSSINNKWFNLYSFFPHLKHAFTFLRIKDNMAPYSTQATMAIDCLPGISPFSHEPFPDLHHLLSMTASIVAYSLTKAFSNFQLFQTFIYPAMWNKVICFSVIYPYYG